MSHAVAEPMPKKKRPEAVEAETTKLEKPVLDMARVAHQYVRTKMGLENSRNYTLTMYLSQCVRGERNLLADHAAYIREEAKKLNIREPRH